jgi:hypothetical protein
MKSSDGDVRGLFPVSLVAQIFAARAAARLSAHICAGSRRITPRRGAVSRSRLSSLRKCGRMIISGRRRPGRQATSHELE